MAEAKPMYRAHSEAPVVIFTKLVHPPTGIEMSPTVRGDTLEEAWGALGDFALAKVQQGWIAVASRDGREALQQVRAQQRAEVAKTQKPLPATSPAPVQETRPAKAPPVATDAEAAETDRFAITKIEKELTKTGNPAFRIYGGRWMKYGVRCWPEVAELLEFDLDAMELGQQYDLTTAGLLAVALLNEKGNPQKVVEFVAG